MITAAQQDIIERALRAAFGTTTYDKATPVTGGMSSALILRVVVAGRAYLVRVGGSPHADAPTEMANVRSAADAGLAPRVLYASVEDRAMITDFVDARPYAPGTATQVAEMIARLQELPPYARALHQIDITDRFIAQYRAANLAADAEDVLAGHAEIAAIYPRDALVACHNDLKPANVLFDGGRPWFVDWEAAFSNDRYADLANIASFLDHEPDALLAAYLGAPADAFARARFFLMRQVIHVSYVTFLATLAARSNVPTQPTPDYRAFHAGLMEGSIDLHSDERKQQYANVHLAAARRAMRSTEFADALACVRDCRHRTYSRDCTSPTPG
jgi:aminoglycoside phosphotransferase (APT) family kinase protein